MALVEGPWGPFHWGSSDYYRSFIPPSNNHEVCIIDSVAEISRAALNFGSKRTIDVEYIDQFLGQLPKSRRYLWDMAMEIHGFIGINGHIRWLWGWLGGWESQTADGFVDHDFNVGEWSDGMMNQHWKMVIKKQYIDYDLSWFITIFPWSSSWTYFSIGKWW